MAQVEWYRYEVYVDGASMGVACVWMARMWAKRVGGAAAGVDAIALGSAVVLRKKRKCMHRVVAWA